ncbi:Zinc finger MYM-type protein [Actinidia chinensis var. chinensis]|uniref:Zinc finger MYM-type protein n=1 Tax=Actinidia chinensis var. chinensis TaxID=1590841 RepID=A0A2R6PRY2_ACTCC|nr:Zinc finger MYM-type protein [Actinidia chinensis var. chinensis]
MEEEKAAAYYDELTRKGEGAARFKQGLGFSSTSHRDSAVPARGSALPSSSRSSFLSSFVRASSPSKTVEPEKQSQLESIQNKLKKAANTSEVEQPSRVSRRRSRSRSRSREGRGSRHRRRSSDRYVERERERERRRRRSRSRSGSNGERGRRRDRRRSRSLSPRDRRREKFGVGAAGKEKNGAIDYAKLIDGFDKMSPAERVKAKMKLQLSEAAEKDATKGLGSGWERFEFDKDAPLDDEDVEAAEDDAALVKHIGQSFRFSAVEARREDQIKAAHDEAMFGAASIPRSVNTEYEVVQENKKNDSKESVPATSLISDKVISQQGSWRDRSRKV